MKYIGIDGHSSTCEISVKDKEGIEVDHAQIETNGRLLVDYLRGIEGPKKVVFEESEISLWLYGVLRDEAEEVVVCNPVVNARYKDKKKCNTAANANSELQKFGDKVTRIASLAYTAKRSPRTTTVKTRYACVFVMVF